MGQPYLRYYSSDEPKAGGAVDNLKLLDTHEATGTESSYTFTPAAALSGDTYDLIIIYISGINTAALALELIINGIVTGYYNDGQRTGGGTITALDENNLAHWVIASATILDTTVDQFNIIVEIQIPDPSIVAGTEQFGMHSRAITSRQKTEIKSGSVIAGNEITSIKIETSTSTWVLGTKINTYGVKY